MQQIIKRQRKMMGIIILLILIAIYGMIGSLDQRDTIRERDQYCQMVQQRDWPDFRHIAKTECRAGSRGSLRARAGQALGDRSGREPGRL